MTALKYPTLLLMMVLLLLIAGCGGGETAKSKADAALADSSVAAPDTNSGFDPYVKSHLEVNEEGRFEAYWPSGCAKLRTRSIPSDRNPGKTLGLDVTCERFRSEESGCKVTVYFETLDGSEATVSHVTGGIARNVAMLGLEIVKQVEMKSHGMEGVAAFCRESGGRRVVWMEGYLHEGRVLQTMAWGTDDQLYQDQEVARFMRSVRLVD